MYQTKLDPSCNMIKRKNAIEESKSQELYLQPPEMNLFLQPVEKYLNIVFIRSAEFGHIRRSIVHDL